MHPNPHPYPAYKSSGVEWLREIPAHWAVRRLKLSVANSTEQTNKRHEHEIYLALEHVESWTGRYSDAGPDVVFDSQVKRFRAGDVLFGKLRPYLAKVVRPDRDGVCVGEFLVLRPRGCAMSPNYLKWLLRTKPVINAINASTYGTKMPRTNWQFIGGMKQPLPPLPEQEAIVRYLDYVERRIRRYIDAKQKLVGLLEELKQATIYEAVTRGLDPDVPLKPSGVEWLGHIPAHWRQLPGKVCYRERKKVLNTGMRENTVLSLSYGQIVVKPPEKLHGLVPASFETYQIVDPSDIIVRPTDLQNDWNSLRFGLCRHHGIITSAYMCLHTKDVVSREYGYLLLHAYDLKKVFYGLGSGLRQNLRWSDFKYLPCLVPPLPEQEAIAEYLDKETTNIDTVLDGTRREIELLQEYRTVLIADVVSGKVDVRDVAANLPDKPE